MANAQSIKRRGFLKGLPVAGLAAMNGSVALAKSNDFDGSLLFLKTRAEQALAEFQTLDPWQEREGAAIFCEFRDSALAMAMLPARHMTLVDAKRRIAVSFAMAGHFRICLPFEVREALERSATKDEALLMGATA